MQNRFKEYYDLTPNEFDKLWKSSIFIFDTNVLLNFYRYSDTTLSILLQVLNRVQDRIWIPYQVGKEFHKDRISVINQQAKIYNDSLSKIKEVQSLFQNENKNPFLTKNLFDEFMNFLERLSTELDEKKTGFIYKIDNDNILNSITTLFRDKVGDEYDQNALKDLFLRANKRYIEKIPPGYQDQQKPEPQKYGDYIIWNQIIDKAKTENKSVIFVSDDRKEDWWLLDGAKILGPRPELRREFTELTQQEFYIYQPFKFLEYTEKYFGDILEIKKDTIDELKELIPIDEENVINNFKSDLLVSVLLSKNKESDIEGFIKLLSSSGYEVHHEVIEDMRSKLYIPLPNIPDLKRRIKNRFLNQVSDFGLEIIEFKPSE